MHALLRYLTVLLIAFGSDLSGQKRLNVTLTNESGLKRRISYDRKPSSSQGVIKEVAGVVSDLQYEGFLLARVDTIMTTDSVHWNVRIDPGKRYEFAQLRLGSLDPSLASRLGVSEKLFTGKPFRYRQTARLFEDIIRWYENHGHPFVAVGFDSIEVSDNAISATLDVRKNSFYKIDSVKFIGNSKTGRNFLFRYLGLKEGMAYNESAVSSVSRKLRQLPFVTEKRPPEARLTERMNKLMIFIDRKEASQFDGIAGVLPDAATGKTTITGDIKLKLVNGVFRNGETVDLEWRRLQSQVMDLNGKFIYPYLFGTPIGTDYALKIYRRDSTFVDITNQFGLQYYFSGLNHFKVYYRERNSSLISSNGLQFLNDLPEYADVGTRSYGTGVQFDKLDYRFNPSTGISFNLSAQVGNRTVRKNPAIPDAVYETVQLKSTQYQSEIHFNSFIPLGGNHVLRFSLQSAAIFGDARIFRNELFRIGGLKTLRGFDEESIFASSYVIPTLEWRFLFSENSNILVFTEGAWYENTAGGYAHDTPVSVGAGMNFDTKAGILSIHYALGSQYNTGFDFRSGKIHFGLTALF